MAKKKQKRDKDKFEYADEILGILFVLLSIIGILGYGRAGNFIRSFSVFLVGILYIVFLIAILVLGLYTIIKRKQPKLLTSRLLGMYIIFSSLLVFLHMEYVKQNEGVEIITETFDNVMISFKNAEHISETGGGMFGALLTYVFNWAFADGIYIVIITLSVLGLILIFNTSLIELFKKIKLPKRDDNEDDEEEEHGEIINTVDTKEESNEDNKIIISSMEEIAHLKDNEVKDDDIPIKDVKDKNDSLETETEEEANPNYKLPPISLLKTGKNINNKDNEINAKESIAKLEEVFKVFEISGHIVQVNIGPSVTQYEMELKAGTKVNKLLSIQREIALALAAKDVRIQAPIPGKSTIGIELPNRVNSSVSFREILSCMPEVDAKNLLAVGLGKDILGKVRWTQINETPHLLVAGSTGSGKSVCINCIITSILMRTRPDQVKLVLVDPKKVEFSMYNGVPHLLSPVVTDPKKASIALKNIVSEMEHRYEILEHTKCKNIKQYNELCEKKPEYKKMSYIVVIIDELADLMMVAAKEVEDSIMRITQMARAAGIHLIVATQRPSTDIITGVVKANIPSRISFAVSSSIDSRTILDMTGAEKLLGKGDMLYLPMGENIPLRIQGAFVSEEEIEKVVNFVIGQQKASYDESLTVDRSTGNETYDDGYESQEEYDDPLYNEIVDFTVRSGKISASLIQRKYRLGYNRAARIVDLLYERGIIGPPNGSKPREVLVKLEDNSNNDE